MHNSFMRLTNNYVLRMSVVYLEKELITKNNKEKKIKGREGNTEVPSLLFPSHLLPWSI